MGHKHSRVEILDGAVAVANAEGLSALTFGRVARHLGISDRVVVYYFPTKDDLVREVLSAVGTRLQATLSTAFTAPATDHLQLLAAAWPVVASAEADPIFALFFEALGLAATGRDPYAAVLPALVAAWIEWTAEFIDGSPDRRRVEAEAAIAVLDGLLLLRQAVGPEAADRAATRLGVR